MSDQLDTIAEWTQYASAFRKLKAYGVSADGSRHSLDCDAIVIELDDERGLIVSLSERLAGEGVAICSLPRGESPSVSPDPKEAEPGPRTTSEYSVLVMRSGGANLLYVSPELHRPGAKPVEDGQQRAE